VSGNPLTYAPALLLLQNSACSYRVWITVIKLLQAQLRHPKINPDIHQGESYAVGCYLRYCGVPRRNSSRKLADQTRSYLRPGTVEREEAISDFVSLS